MYYLAIVPVCTIPIDMTVCEVTLYNIIHRQDEEVPLDLTRGARPENFEGKKAQKQPRVYSKKDEALITTKTHKPNPWHHTREPKETRKFR